MNIGDKIAMVPEEEYFKLLERDRWLCALEAAGVDNWEGFEEAQRIIAEWEAEDEST